MATPEQYRRNGLIGTVIFHGALLLMLLLMAFYPPYPLPEEQGILVDFGNSNRGFGAVEPRPSEPAAVQPQPAPAQPTPAKETILTQEHEESVAIPEPKKPAKETPKEQPKETPKETPKEQPKPVVETPKEPERTVNQRALYPGKGDAGSTATSQGDAGGQGNQGVKTCAPNVHVYGEGGDSGGNGFSLSGRSLQGGRLPKPDWNSQEQGKVVVKITVDKEGNVIDAVYEGKGSTTLNTNLVNAALKAAKQAKFNRKPDAPMQQGTITYVFKLQGE